MLTATLIAGTRAKLARHLARHLRLAARRAARRIRLTCKRIAEAHRQRRELEILLHADDRLLADIGLTRSDVHFAFRGRLAETPEASFAADAPAKLPQVDSPSLAPALPRQTIAHENFR